MNDIDHYLDQACRRVSGPVMLRRHLRRELREHLEEEIEALVATGLSRDEATTRAIEDLGEPETIRDGMQSVYGQSVASLFVDQAMSSVIAIRGIAGWSQWSGPVGHRRIPNRWPSKTLRKIAGVEPDWLENLVMEFGNLWRGDKGQFFVDWTESDARKAHESGRSYSALCEGADWDRVALHVQRPKNSVEVAFLDSRGRVAGKYVFWGPRPGDDTSEKRLLLKQAWWDWFENDKTWSVGHLRLGYSFQRDGRYTRWVSRGEDSIKIEGTIDLERHWEVFPEFGQYEGFARVHRGQPWDASAYPEEENKILKGREVPIRSWKSLGEGS